MLGRVLEVIAVITLATPIAIFGHVFYDDHLPAFKTLQAKVFFSDCIAQCEANARKTCELNDILWEKCQYNCDHCHVFIHDGEHE